MAWVPAASTCKGNGGCKKHPPYAVRRVFVFFEEHPTTRGVTRADVFSTTAAQIGALTLFIDLVALVEVDGAAGVAFEAGVEEPGRVLERMRLLGR